jgi:hypothetical protein
MRPAGGLITGRKVFLMDPKKESKPKFLYTLEHTGQPYAHAHLIPEDAWKPLSKHKSLAAVIKRARSEMRHLAPLTWDDHFRIRRISDGKIASLHDARQSLLYGDPLGNAQHFYIWFSEEG